MRKGERGYLNHTVDTSGISTIIHIGNKQCYKGEPCGPMIRNMYLLHFIMSGKGIYSVNNKTYHLKAGDVFAIYPKDIAFYEADNDAPWHFCWIGFVGDHAEEYYKRIGITPDSPTTHLNNNMFSEVVNKCLDYIEKNEKEGLSALRLEAYILEILSTFETAKVKNQNSYINNAILYMEINYHQRFSLCDLAEHVNLEYSYFYKLFKSFMGTSPNQYLTKLRIEKSKQLLEAGIEIKKIPELVGISDVYYFSKVFKKFTGLSPAQYRRSFSS